MPRIFIDTSTATPLSSGTGRYTRALALAVARQGELVVPDGCWSPAENASERVNHHVLINVGLAGNHPGIHADAALFPNYFMPPGWPWPSAVTIHDLSFITHPEYYSRRMRTYYRMRIGHTVRNARLLLTVSETSKKTITRLLGVAPDKVLVHPPSPPLQVQRTHSPSDRPCLLYIGNLEPKKNIIRMLDAFGRLDRAGDVQFVLAGKMHGPARWAAKVKRLIRSTPGVVWNGYVTNDTMTDYLANCRGLVNVSHIEGFGLPVLDALANDIPVLISEDAALVELAGDLAIRADAMDTGSIADGMARLLSHKKPDSSSMAMHQVFGEKACEDSVESIIDRLTGPTSFFFPSDIERSGISRVWASPEEANLLGNLAYASVFNAGMNIQKLRLTMPHAVSTAGSGSTDDEIRHLLKRVMDNHTGLICSEEGTYWLGSTGNEVLSGEHGQKQEQEREQELERVRVQKQERERVQKQEQAQVQEKAHRIEQVIHQSHVCSEKRTGPGIPIREHDIMVKRHEHLRNSNRRLLRRLLAFPYIRGLYYSGGTAHGTGLWDKPDLDLMVITSDNCAWLGLATVRLMSLLSGRGNTLCANYLLSESSQEVFWQRDYYTAHQLLFLRKVALKPGTDHIRAKNGWIRQFFPNLPVPKLPRPKQPGPMNKKSRLRALPLRTINLMLMFGWSFFWKSRGLRSGEGGMLWDLHRIKLHTNDHRPRISARFREMMIKVTNSIAEPEHQGQDKPGIEL